MTRKCLTKPLAGAAVALAMAGVAFAQDAQRTQGETQRDGWQKVDTIFAAMAVKPGAAVADIGAGGGYFTSRLSKAVGENGHVFAVDIDQDALRRLKARIAQEQSGNVDVLEATSDDPRLAPGSIDAALIVNAYHEMKDHQAVLAQLKAALKPGGRLVIVEPISESKRGSTRDQQTARHEIGIDFVKQDAREAGFTQVQSVDPFTTRPDARDDMWMLVLTPQSAGSAAFTAAGKEDWQSPALRISVEDFKALRAEDVVVLDVRDRSSYRAGHLPGAILMTFEDLANPAKLATLAGEKRPIVAYCS